MPGTVAFITLGCAKNEVDTNRMRALVGASSFEECDNPAQASIVVVNTCSFITEATEEAIATIFEVLGLENFTSGDAKLVVAGCLPARYGTSLAPELPEVAAFIPASDEDNIVAILEGIGKDRGTVPASFASSSSSPPSLLRVVDAPWAYVKVSDGCDRRCSFCTIPAIRGPYRSTPAPALVAEVEGLVAGGVHEIILIGQDTGIWAHDLDTCPSPSPHNLAQLLDTLAVCFPHTWFRVMYLQPQGVTGELLATMAAHPNICRYLDIPLQHASARILRAMNRAGSGQDYLARIRTIREALPGVTLRTSLIAGFPGETREDARELEHFVDDAQLDYAGVFVYSREDGTPAGECANQVPLRTRRARAQRLRDRADVAGFARAAAQVGSEAEVLVCGVDEEGPWGRTKGQAPEVDGVTHLDTGMPGSVVRVRIVQASCYELYAEAL